MTSLVARLIVLDVDFGDAPAASYPTLRAQNGARHAIIAGLHLGANIDAELDGQPDASANGDDATGGDDEDGVSFLSPVRPGQTASVEVVASASGVLNAWIDFDGDGSWAGGGEQIFTNRALVAGVNTLDWSVAAYAGAGQHCRR